MTNDELRALIEAEWKDQSGPVQTTIIQGISPSPTLKELLPAVPSSSGQLPPGVLPPAEVDEPVLRRFRPPFDNTTKHDARGDALSICYDILIQKRVPVWAAHLISHEFVDQKDVQEKFQVASCEFDGVNYERINAYGWCRDIIQKFNQFMTEMANGKHPLPEKPSDCDKWLVSFSAHRSKRPKMEDRHTIVPCFSCIEPATTNYQYKDDAFFAVFDGHNGYDVSNYISSHFHRAFLKFSEDTDPMQRLKKAYEYTDKLLDLRCEKENYKSGSTAAGVLISNRKFYMFWCGDASIGLLHNGSILTLSRRHVPSNKKEYERIIAVGGSVINVNGELRINGVLNITRSMGELLGKPMISSEPDMEERSPTDDDWILFLSSDGVWDELSPTEILNLCTEFAKKYPSDHYSHLADYIVNDCRQAGGRDNMTLIVVFLKPIEDVWAHLNELLTRNEKTT